MFLVCILEFQNMKNEILMPHDGYKPPLSTKKNWKIEKRILSSAASIHGSALVRAGSLWPCSPSCIHKLQVISTTPEVKPADGHQSHCENA
jgi:hypothetical protein